MKKQSQNKNNPNLKALPRAWRAAFERLDAALRENITRDNNARKIAILRKLALANAEHFKAPGELERMVPKRDPNNSQPSATNSQLAVGKP
jgi:hypothetical protein